MTSGEAIFVSLIVQTITIFGSLLGVILTILWTARIAGRRATLELLLSEQTDPVLLEFRSQFLNAWKNGEIEEYAQQDKYYFSSDSFFLASTINRCDLVAIGIKQGIIDKNIFKAYWRSSYVMDWSRCKEAVMLRRKFRNDPKLFCDFEELARKWALPEEVPLI